MCMAVPSRIISLDDQIATVEAFGVQRKVSLLLMREPLAAGDYLLIQAGGFAYERLDPVAARQALDTIEHLLALGAEGLDAAPSGSH